MPTHLRTPAAMCLHQHGQFNYEVVQANSQILAAQPDPGLAGISPFAKLMQGIFDEYFSKTTITVTIQPQNTHNPAPKIFVSVWWPVRNPSGIFSGFFSKTTKHTQSNHKNKNNRRKFPTSTLQTVIQYTVRYSSWDLEFYAPFLIIIIPVRVLLDP